MTPFHFIPRPAPLPPYVAAVLATSYYNPMHNKSDVERDLAERGVSGLVLLDFLLANASATHRYFAIQFDGRRFQGLSSKVERTEALESYSKRAFRSCPFKLNKTLLLSPAVRALV